MVPDEKRDWRYRYLSFFQSAVSSSLRRGGQPTTILHIKLNCKKCSIRSLDKNEQNVMRCGKVQAAREVINHFVAKASYFTMPFKFCYTNTKGLAVCNRPRKQL